MAGRQRKCSTFLILIILILILFFLFSFSFTGVASSTQNSSLEITETQLTEANAFWSLAIYEDRVVWSDARNWDIYMYNISTSKKTQITKDEANQWHSAIYGDRIVWDDYRNGNWDIYMYNLSTHNETQITENESHQTCPVIYRDIIAWQDYRAGKEYENPDIFIYDLSTHKGTQITTDESRQEYPAIYGDRIVWMDGRNRGVLDEYGEFTGNWDIYMYNLSSSRETQITTNESVQLFPAIYKDKIIWADYSNDSKRLNNPEIFMYNLSTYNETHFITDSKCFVPAVYEDKIVWEYWPEGENANSDIYMYNISTLTETQITKDESYQGSPAIYADRIVWRDERNQGSYIYMYAPGSNLPSAAFSAIPTSGNLPLNVKFTDETTDSPTAWYWNFGDGNNSTRRNPEHIYSKPGNYTVTLRVSNVEGTDAETKVDYISVINEPENLKVEQFFSILNSELLKVYLSISEFIASRIAIIEV